MSATDENPLRVFTLDLLYPAVLGTLIVLLFLRFASLHVSSFKDVNTYFGLILAFFYIMGFLTAKSIHPYSLPIAALDCLSTVLMFICFFALGFSDQPSSETDHHTNFVVLYGAFVVIFFIPYLRRGASGNWGLKQFRNLLTFIAVGISFIGLLSAAQISWMQWAAPWLTATAIGMTLVVYLVDVGIRGARTS